MWLFISGFVVGAVLIVFFSAVLLWAVAHPGCTTPEYWDHEDIV